MLSKPSLRWVFIASGITLVLIALSTISFFAPRQQTPIRKQSLLPQVLQAQAAGVSFKTYKGLNFPWGINNRGVSTFRDWLSSKYDEQVTTKAFEEIKNMGVRTVGMWLWFDRMLIKDDKWGTDAYVTKFDPTFKANWESFLKNVVKAKDMEVVVTMFTPLSSTERDPYNLELGALVPVFSGADILGAGVANGDMTVDTNPKDNLPDGWNINLGNPPTGSYLWENNDSTPGSPAKYLKVTSTTGSTININSPKVPYTSQGGLYALSITYKGALVSFQTTYYDSAGKYLDKDFILTGDPGGNPKGYSDNWKTFTWASRTAVIPAGTAQIGITAVADSNATTYIGPARIGPGARNAKWRNYMQTVKDWISMYGSSTEYGPAIASWHGIKEVSDGWMFHVTRDFSRDLYQAIKSTGTSQPVGIDNSPYFRLAVTEPKNQPWFSDAADYYSLHIYDDNASIPDTSKLDKPFILGEFGAENNCPNGGYPEKGDCKPGETNLANPNADWNLNAVSKFYPNGKSAGAKTALGWAWVSNPTIAQHNLDGTNVLGNAGQWIKDWNPDGTATPTPAPTPNPASATFSLQTGTSYTQGAEIPVKVMAETSTDSANTFVGKINFPAELLSVSRIDTTGSFVTNWTENYYDNTEGTISLVGAVPNHGYKTSGSPSLMATVYFTSKTSGTANLTFDPASMIYRNSDNANILAKATGASVTINPTASPLPGITPVSTPSPTPGIIPTPTHLPAPLSLTAAAVSYKQVNLSWKSAGTAVATYWIIRDNVTIAKTTTESYSDTTVSPSTNYSYQVVATDKNGTNSEPSNIAAITTPTAPDTTAPTAPVNVEAIAVTSSQINLSWGPSTDNIGVVAYDIYQNDTLLISVSGKTMSFGATGLNPATAYHYSVIAKDAAGNSSEISNTAEATTLALATPTPTPLPIKGDFSKDDVINLLDHSILLSNWGKAKANFNPIDVDLNSDGVLNVFDFAILKQILIDNNIIRVNP